MFVFRGSACIGQVGGIDPLFLLLLGYKSYVEIMKCTSPPRYVHLCCMQFFVASRDCNHVKEVPVLSGGEDLSFAFST